MKWSKSKVVSLAGAASLLITAVLFAGPYKEKAGFIFNWFIDGVKYMELDTTGLKADNISDLAGTGSPDFQNGLNIDDEPTLVAEYMTATTTPGAPAPGSAVFYSEIVGRQPMLDLSKIPSGKFGVERVMFSTMTRVSGESVPSGEAVLSPLDDRFRYFGPGSMIKNANGTYLDGDSGELEVVCYCTGLNILGINEDGIRDARATVDGGAEGANFMPAGVGPGLSVVLGTRGYEKNVVHNVVSGLTLGVHTIKIRGNTWLRPKGFEILNEATTVAIPAGSIVDNGRKYTTTATTDDLTTFENEYQNGVASGSSTKGGHVVRYFDNDGTIKKDINYTDSATNYFTGTVNHSNEEIVQRLNWNVFGSGRADDFSTVGTAPVNRAFTLADGTTTLLGNDYGLDATKGAMVAKDTTASLTITFIGTGLDFIKNDGAVTISAPYTIEIDGVNIGVPSTTPIIGNMPIVSGLPFGTHTVSLINTGGGEVHKIVDFLIYAPKKPVLTDGQVEIDSTYKVADFVANTVAGTLTISTGVIRKYASREINYEEGTTGSSLWTISSVTSNNVGGFEVSSDKNLSGWKYTFYGTGVDFRFNANTSFSSNVLVRTDAGTLNTTTYPSIAGNTSAYGGGGFSEASGVAIENGSTTIGSGIVISALPLDRYTIYFQTQIASVSHQIHALDIITPTYSYSNNLLNTDDALVGSNSLKNEILVPGATKNKIIATDGIDLGGDSNIANTLAKEQGFEQKCLTVAVTSGVGPGNSAAEATELAFYNLEMGAVYEYTFNWTASVTNGAGFVIVNWATNDNVVTNFDHSNMQSFSSHTSTSGHSHWQSSMTNQFVSRGFLRTYVGASLGGAPELSKTGNTNTVTIPGVSNGSTQNFCQTWMTVRKVSN